MQNNVKVFTPEALVAIFGHVKVKGDFTYKLQVPHINSREMAELAKLNEDYGMNFHVKRSGKGLVVYSPSIPDNTIYPAGKRHETVRDFYELVLPDEARVFAFENTAKIKLDRDAKNLFEAIMDSFYISDSPQGANYWQDIILQYAIR